MNQISVPRPAESPAIRFRLPIIPWIKEKLGGNELARALTKFVMIPVAAWVAIILSWVLSTSIGALCYRIIGVAATPKFALWNPTEFVSYVSLPVGYGDQHTFTVGLIRGFTVLAIFGALWLLTRKSRNEWLLATEFALAFSGLMHIFMTFAGISSSDLMIGLFMMGVLLSLIAVCILYRRRLEDWVFA